MPKLEFSNENKAQNDFDFPKLKLKKGEVARLAILEDPIVEYAHDLRMPQILAGVPQRETKTRKDGGTYDAFKMDFVGRYISLGDFSILQNKGSDPDHCPMSRAARESDEVEAPRRRFAMHVIRYNTKPGSADLIEPFGVQTLVWAFTEKTFNKLVDLKNEWKDLKKHDLILTCTNGDFQQFDISVSATAAWREDKSRQTLTVETLKNNRAADLSTFCGRKVSAEYLEEEIAKVHRAWAIANGNDSEADASAQASSAFGVGTDFESGLDNLLEDTSAPESVAPAATLDDLLEASNDEPSATALDDAIASSNAEPVDDLESLLAGIDDD